MSLVKQRPSLGKAGEGCDLGSDPQKTPKSLILGGEADLCHPKRALFDPPLVLQSVCAQGFWTGSIYVAHIGGGHTLCVYGTGQLFFAL